MLTHYTQNTGAEQELIDAFKVFDTRGNGRLKATEVSGSELGVKKQQAAIVTPTPVSKQEFLIDSERYPG